MKLTKSQKIDIELCKYFYSCTPTDLEIQEYLDMSERGIGSKMGKMSNNPLIVGKTRRGLMMQMWEEGVIEGTVPYFTLLGGYCGDRKYWWQFWRSWHKPLPRIVVDFIKKEMFKGADSHIIEKCYLALIKK